MNLLIRSYIEPDQNAIQAAFPNEYKNITLFSQGSFSKVYRAENNNKEIVAIKVVDKTNQHAEIIPYLENEIKLLSESDNRNVIQLIKSHQSKERLILVLESCFIDVEQMQKTYYKNKVPDHLVVIIFRQIANGLCYLHRNKIIHRDLKLQNFVVQLTKQDEDALQTKNDLTVFERATYKLIDLGLAKKLDDFSVQTNTRAGTELNMAPEILNGLQFSFQADIYSLGVCLYQLLVGKYPYFNQAYRLQQQDLIKEENADFYLITNVSLRNLIEKMLKYDPKQRLTFNELYQHEFFKYKERDLSNPLDLELNNNQLIYSQNLDPNKDQSQINQFLDISQERNIQNAMNKEQQKIFSEFMSQQIPKKSLQINQSNQPIIFTDSSSFNLLNKHDQQRIQNQQIMQLYHLRNQYIVMMKIADIIEQIILMVKGTKLDFMTMQSKFTMYFQYFRMVSKQLYLKLTQRFSFYQLTLGGNERFKLLEKIVKDEDSPNFNKIEIIEGDSNGPMYWLQKKLFKKMNCEPSDSINFSQQYEKTNIELYIELLKMLQDTFYKDPSDSDPKIKRIKCLLYLSMINTARSRGLFKTKRFDVDYKAEELLLSKYCNEPDILSDKVTDILTQFNLKYD